MMNGVHYFINNFLAYSLTTLYIIIVGVNIYITNLVVINRFKGFLNKFNIFYNKDIILLPNKERIYINFIKG